MHVVWIDQFPELSEAQLRDWEVNRGVKLPQSYITFIQEYRGGYVKSGDCFIEIPNGFSTWIDVWHGNGDSESSSIHDVSLGNFSQRVAEQMVQFASDGGGEIFVIDLREHSYGKVYVRAHDEEPNMIPIIDSTGFESNDLEEAQLYHLVANDFDEFLSMLGPEPDD